MKYLVMVTELDDNGDPVSRKIAAVDGEFFASVCRDLEMYPPGPGSFELGDEYEG